MEAGIKEQKGVFTMRRPLVRSRSALALQEAFSVFAANFVRWAAQWATQLIRQANHRLWQALGEVKTLVRVVAHSRARVVQTAQGSGLLFDPHGPFADSLLVFAGQVAYQEVLPLFKCASDAPTEVT